MVDKPRYSQDCNIQIALPNGLNLTLSAPMPVLKHLLVSLGQEEVMPAWLVHLLLVVAQAEEA